jgi:hypothetical protein
MTTARLCDLLCKICWMARFLGGRGGGGEAGALLYDLQLVGGLNADGAHLKAQSLHL